MERSMPKKKRRYKDDDALGFIRCGTKVVNGLA